MVIAYETQTILVLGISIVSSFMLNVIIRKLKLPRMIMPLLIGLLLNFYFVHVSVFIPNFKEILETFANFGIIIMLFFVGLKVDFHYMRNLSKNSSIMALNAGHIPFFMGMFATFFFTRDVFQSLFVGLALAITAEEVSVAILDELNLLKKRVGQLIMDAGIIGDVFEISAIALLGLFMRTRALGQSFSIFSVLFELFMLIFIIMVMRYYLIDYLLKIPQKGKKYDYFAVAFIVLLIMTVTTELLNFSYIIGALLAGLLLKDKLIQDKMYREEHLIIESIEVFDFGVFHPLIFIWIGLSLDLNLLSSNIGFGILLTILALSGKIIGCVIGNYFCDEPIKEGILIGWGLNARGATELFAVLIAKNQGLVSRDIFSAIVFMALITTIVSPIVFKILVLKKFGLVSRRHHKHNAIKHVVST